MSQHREALEKILALCNESRTYTRATQHIHEVAMIGLGMTANQRINRHTEIFDRIGDKPLHLAFLARRAKREAKQAELNEEVTQ